MTDLDAMEALARARVALVIERATRAAHFANHLQRCNLEAEAAVRHHVYCVVRPIARAAKGFAALGVSAGALSTALHTMGPAFSAFGPLSAAESAALATLRIEIAAAEAWDRRPRLQRWLAERRPTFDLVAIIGALLVALLMGAAPLLLDDEPSMRLDAVELTP